MSARSVILAVSCAAGAVFLAAMAGGAGVDDRLSFDVSEGLNLNSFLRDGPVSAHLVLRSGVEPRLIVAFPAGNSGVGVWFSPTDRPVTWRLAARPQPLTIKDHRGRALHGLTATVTVTGGELQIKQAVLSSVRVLRDYQSLGKIPDAVTTGAVTEGRTVTWTRDRLDGAAGYRLSLEVIHGQLRAGHLEPDRDGNIGIKVTALTGEIPLTPLAGAHLLNDEAGADQASRNTLAFLSYREKFLAGSWRFNTYFGRDTLISVRLLMRVLSAEAVESGLASVLTRLSSAGEVAHEEAIGEFAVLEHRHNDEKPSDRPVFDYKMIDGNYLLAPVACAWLLDDERGRGDAARFLADKIGAQDQSARAAGADLVTNLRFVVKSAAAFADDERPSHLIGLKAGLRVGDWRDSEEGLGRGRYPYDVNAVLVPAALEAAGRLLASGLLEPYLSADDRALFSRAASMALVWRKSAPPLFEVTVPNSTARSDIQAYATEQGLPADAALRSIGESPLRFHALSLDADGVAVPVVHSDEGFELLFGRPDAAAVAMAADTVARPFPAGLMTDVGMVVANAAFAAPPIRARFNKNAYHGAVIWSWQQAVLAAGLERQMRGEGVPDFARQRLRETQQLLKQAIKAGRAVRNSELWSWTYAAGRFQVAPFGANSADADESNAAQLWSTVYLSLPETGR